MLKDFGLNSSQFKAATCDLGPVLVVAGAGTGKTRVLIARILYLLQEFKLNPNQILAITFTNKAANELKARIGTYFEKVNFHWINTFHAFCLKVLRYEINELGFRSSFSIIDDIDKKSCFEQLYIQTNASKEVMKVSDAINYIDKCKSKNLSINEFIEHYKINEKLSVNQCQQLKMLYSSYNAYLKEVNTLDFNDLLNFTYKIFTSNKEILEKWANTFEYILVDEFQDTDSIQYEIVSLLAKNHKNIFVVGDPDQSIYSWRGANPKMIDIFADDFNNCQVYKLEENYRSTTQILNVANDIISHNNSKYFKNLYSDKRGPLVRYHLSNSQDAESSWIIQKIKELVRSNVKYGEITLLYRSNFLTRNVEQALINARIPYYVYGAIKFYQRKEIKDLIAYLKVIDNKDEVSLWRVINSPSRKVSEKSIEKIIDYANQNRISKFEALKHVQNIGIYKPAVPNVLDLYYLIQEFENKELSISETLKKVIAKTKYLDQFDETFEQDRIQNINELITSIEKFEDEYPEKTLNDFLQEIQLYMSADDETKRDQVNLMTVHMAKGLEFNYVIIFGLIENIFPSTRVDSESDLPAKIEEERRIMYVAVTRAKKELCLTSSRGLNYDNTAKSPSRFIAEINPENLESSQTSMRLINDINDDWYDSQKKVKYQNNYHDIKDTPEYVIGDTIQHTLFGEGVVIEVKQRTIVVAFNNIKVGRKELVSNHKSIIRKSH